MSTDKQTPQFVLNKLKDQKFSVKPMFGEYAFYCDGKVVGLICDNLLYIKITKESIELDPICEKDHPYPGSKLYYLVEETQLDTILNLSEILFNISKALPAKKPKK